MTQDYSEYNYSIEHSPIYAAVNVDLGIGESLIVEKSAMAGMDSAIKLKSFLRGGIFKSIGRLFTRESLLLTKLTASNQEGSVYLSPATSGDIRHYYLDGETPLIVQSAGFLACSPNIEMETRFEGIRGFFSGESLFLIRAKGEGDFWFSSYGAIIEVPVTEEYVIDTGYIVAFEETLDYNVEVIGGLSFKNLRTAIFGGEGLVCRFQGEGRVWIQSRALEQLINFLNPFRRLQRRSDNNSDNESDDDD